MSNSQRWKSPQTPSSSRKRLFNSSPSSPTNTTPTKVGSFTGYLVAVGVLQTGQSKNVFFDIKLKTSETDFATIRVMQLGLPENSFNKRKNKPVTLCNVGENKGTLFFNPQRGSKIVDHKYELDYSKLLRMKKIVDIKTDEASSVDVEGSIYWLEETESNQYGTQLREGVIADLTGDIRITVWKPSLIDAINEKNWYCLTDCMIKQYYGLKLSTTRLTVIEKLETSNRVTDPDLDKYRKTATAKEIVCCPDVMSVAVSEEISCIACKAALVCEENQPFVKCLSCKRKQIVSKCQKQMQGLLHLQKDDKDLELKFSASVVNNYFIDDTPVGIDDVEERLLLLTNVDVEYTVDDNDIISINDHG